MHASHRGVVLCSEHGVVWPKQLREEDSRYQLASPIHSAESLTGRWLLVLMRVNSHAPRRSETSVPGCARKFLRLVQKMRTAYLSAGA